MSSESEDQEDEGKLNLRSETSWFSNAPDAVAQSVPAKFNEEEIIEHRKQVGTKAVSRLKRSKVLRGRSALAGAASVQARNAPVDSSEFSRIEIHLKLNQTSELKVLFRAQTD
ncbi:hypothetical protein ACJRO7_014910 [Eucalyptus globulus]|uniref:Uncharacterized protein n=1 Tax=Eucalyptus globulus TaxID=34317 RepID=A0ABD3L7J7_EUCGL